VFPQTTVRTCIIRTSLNNVHRWHYDAVVKDLRPIYTAIDSDHALQALNAFKDRWGAMLPPVVRACMPARPPRPEGQGRRILASCSWRSRPRCGG
jgi:transposase-like protein